MAIFGLSFNKKNNEKEKAVLDKSSVKEEISSKGDQTVNNKINESVNDTESVNDSVDEKFDELIQIVSGEEDIVLESTDSDVDIIDLTDLGAEEAEALANTTEDENVPAKEDVAPEQSDNKSNDDKNEALTISPSPTASVKKDIIDNWLTDALNEELKIAEEEADITQKSTLHDDNASHEFSQITHEVISSHDFINKHLDDSFENLLSESKTASETFLSIQANSKVRSRSYSDEREQIEINFDEVTSQLQRLKSIFNTKPYPPNELIHHQLEKLSNNLPFESLNVNSTDVDNIVKNQLLMIEAIQEKEMKIKVAEQDVKRAKAFIRQLDKNRTGLASEMIGLKFQKQLLENTIISLAKKFSESPDEQINILDFLEKDDLKNASFIKIFEKWQESSDESLFSFDSWWLMLFSKEIMSITTYGKEGHQVKHKFWYDEIEGIGDVFANIIEEIILENYPNSRVAFAVSIAQAVRSQLCEMAIFDEQCNETVRSDIIGMHKIWKRFLGQLYLSSIKK